MAASISKADYLKRYLDTKSAKNKAKKGKKVAKFKLQPRSKIVDDDVDIIVPKEGDYVEHEYGDDAPQVAGIVDERPEDVQKMEQFSQKKKWRVLGASDEEEGEDVPADGSSKQRPQQQTGRWNSLVVLKEKTGLSSSSAADGGTESCSRRRHDSGDSDGSPSSKHLRHDSGSDGSPSRQSRRRDSGSDQSPPRITRVKTEKRVDESTDQSPPRKSRRRRRQSSNSDLFPPRKNDNLKTKIKVEPRDSESDQSPPRRSESREPSLMRKTLDGKRAGLQDAATLRRENDAARKRENRLFEMAGDERLGRNSETVVRDRASGKRRDFKAEEQKKQEAAALKEAREAKYKQWNKGLKQTDMQKERLEFDLREISKPLARYEDDEDLDKHLREQDREGDPMLAFIKKKKKVAAGLDPDKEVPKYSGPPGPPNRYGIDPGYRWDGVDRSNGFEKSRFSRQNDRKARLEQAYKWSVEDM